MFLMPMFGCNLKIKKQATKSGEKTTKTTETSALSTGTVHSHCSKIFQRVHFFGSLTLTLWSLIYGYIMKSEANKINVTLFFKKYCKQCVFALNRKWQ